MATEFWKLQKYLIELAQKTIKKEAENISKITKMALRMS